MSAPNTNIDKQARRHRGPLKGMFAVVLFALLLLVGLLFYVFGGGSNPQGADTQVQSGIGTTTTQDSAVIAGDDAADSGTGSGGQPDPTAVTVPAQTVTAPEGGLGVTADTDPGSALNAQPGPVGETVDVGADQPQAVLPADQ
jgi:hypothetical protein